MTHTCMHTRTHIHAHTCTYTKQSKAKPSAAVVTRSHGHLCTTQVLRVMQANPPGGRTGISQGAVPCLTSECVTHTHTYTHTHTHTHTRVYILLENKAAAILLCCSFSKQLGSLQPVLQHKMGRGCTFILYATSHTYQ